MAIDAWIKEDLPNVRKFHVAGSVLVTAAAAGPTELTELLSGGAEVWAKSPVILELEARLEVEDVMSRDAQRPGAVRHHQGTIASLSSCWNHGRRLYRVRMSFENSIIESRYRSNLDEAVEAHECALRLKSAARQRRAASRTGDVA